MIYQNFSVDHSSTYLIGLGFAQCIVSRMLSINRDMVCEVQLISGSIKPLDSQNHWVIQHRNKFRVRQSTEFHWQKLKDNQQSSVIVPPNY